MSQNFPYLSPSLITNAEVNNGRATDLTSSTYKIDRTALQQAEQRSREPDSYKYSLQQELDPKKFQQSMDLANAVGYRLGYIEGLLEVNKSLQSNKFAGVLSADDEKRLRGEASQLQRGLDNVAFNTPEAYNGVLSDRGNNARQAGRDQAKLDANESRKEAKGAGFLDLNRQAELSASVRLKLDYATLNPLVK